MQRRPGGGGGLGRRRGARGLQRQRPPHGRGGALLIPEVNAGHLALVAGRSAGFIVTNPNCGTVGLALALAPPRTTFGVSAVHVTTLQAVSGAGHPGFRRWTSSQCAARDPRRGSQARGRGAEDPRRAGRRGDPPRAAAGLGAGVPVPVVDGHLLSLSVRLRRRATAAQAREELAAFGRDARLELPSSPERVLAVFDDGPFPPAAPHAGLGGGMTVSVGRVRRCPAGDLRLVALVHNTMRGAAGAALLNAELLVERGLVRRRAGAGAAEERRPWERDDEAIATGWAP